MVSAGGHGSRDIWNPSSLLRDLESRAITAENPRGERGAGGTAAGGRKGSAWVDVAPGDAALLVDFPGPAVVRHFWLTYPPGSPEQMRSVWLEVNYDGRAEPSISTSVPDFFAMPHGRPVPLDSAMISVHEGRGFNSYFPMPFRDSIRVVIHNDSDRRILLFYQLDLTVGEIDSDVGYLHASFRRENPTTLGRDFVIEDGLRGPGRFVGASVGIRPLGRPASWYGEGEVKIFLDGDDEHPTICGTGLEDYVGSAWGMRAHQAQLAGVPLLVRADDDAPQPELVSFYRWHLPDPIVFEDEIRVTLQQIGATWFTRMSEFEAFKAENEAAGSGWTTLEDMSTEQRDQAVAEGLVARGLYERRDDVCAVAYTYCRDCQMVPPLDVEAALQDV
jgi:D-arabinan exo alpha-(1,3)/(1,5)-arabinofuranosidase (non-reducing end)